MNQGDSDVQGLRRARVVTYDPVRRVGKLKLVPERGRDLQFFLSVLEGKLKEQVVEASRRLNRDRRKVPEDPGYREIVQVAKRLLVGRELLVELKEGVHGRVSVRRAIELVDES